MSSHPSLFPYHVSMQQLFHSTERKSNDVGGVCIAYVSPLQSGQKFASSTVRKRFSSNNCLRTPPPPHLCLPLSCFLHKLFALDREKSGTKSNDAGGVVLSPFKVGKSIPFSKYSCLGLKYSYLRVLPMLPHCLKFSCPIQATAANPKMDNVWKKSLIV